MEMVINFNGGLEISAQYKGFDIKTDQPSDQGGNGSAPEPSALFFASLGTCAGVYVLRFCQTRDLPTDQVKLVQRMNFDPKTGKLVNIDLEIKLPEDFPEKYVKPVARAANLCWVKKTILDPPEMSVRASRG